jgi:type VI secretion system ImpC/EvpB family protein
MPRDDTTPMRLLVLGDFSGKPVAERPPLESRPAQRLDIDTLDDAMLRLAPRLTLPAGEIRFRRIDDFHPDQLFKRLELFKALREARANAGVAAGELLRDLLGKPHETGAAPAAAPATGLDALIRDIVAPHIVTDASAHTTAYLRAVDAAIAEQMRALLHHPAFQALEAAWRGVRWLLSSLEFDEHLQLHLFDVTRDELQADLVHGHGTLADTGLYRTLVDRVRGVPGEHPWTAIVALNQFGPSDADIGLLAALGRLAAQSGGPILAGADAQLAGNDADVVARWRELRRTDAAAWIGLAAPRVLQRLPYGQRCDPVESFAFEEVVGLPVHDEFLWGNPALAVALLIARSFTASGWAMELDDEREIDDLPAYSFERDGEPQMQACSERFLPESEIYALLDAGLIPIVSRRDRNAVVAIRIQSVSDPPAPLAW